MYNPCTLVGLVLAAFFITPSFAFFTWSYPPQTLAAFQSILKDDSQSACLNPSSTEPLLASSGTGVEAYTKALNTWLSGFCTRPACDNATLASIGTQLLAVRAADLGDRPSDEGEAEDEVKPLQAVYPIYRELICLRTGNDFCMAPLIASEMAAAPSISTPELPLVLFPLPLSMLPGPDDTPYISDSFKCSDCHKAMTGVLTQKWNRYRGGDGTTKVDIEKECGAGFLDGTMPESITLASDSPSGNTTSSSQTSKDSASGTSTPSASASSSAPSSSAQKLSTFIEWRGLSILVAAAIAIVPASGWVGF